LNPLKHSYWELFDWCRLHGETRQLIKKRLW
jgi:hypothetical protein